VDDDEESERFLKKTAPDHIKLKEFECDVSINEGPDGKGRERQEFSFTLYDFDGHGKITKDDIAGLVTTIYETLGSSVKVPHCGSKTIRVKLIVSPNADHNHNSEEGKKSTADSKPPSPTSQPKTDCSSSPKGKKKKYHRKESDYNHFQFAQTKPDLNCSCCGQSKKRSSSFQKQQLLKILQANMEKNNLAFQPPRRHPAWHQEKEKTPRPHYRFSEEPSGRHHQKHKDREAEQARAMAQVVRWLEQEFIAPKKHHHVHEHVHHHYHHYQDPPIVA
ncbi:hypothetical protein GE061_020178, partial [Apolygus lucorum]